MGGTSAKFRKALQTGDERAAEEIYHNNSDFQKSLDPNTSYGENYDHNTPLHFASRYGMLKLLRLFVQKHNGNPNKRNNLDQTSLHCLCMYETLHPAATQVVHVQYYAQPLEQKRLECLKLLLSWKGVTLGNGEREKVDINVADTDGNTALHYAAESGYTMLVELLLENGASLFTENVDKETPCDRAEKQKLFELAQYLESKMVFCDLDNESSLEDVSGLSYEESYMGMRTQDLQRDKDQLLVETADMLRVPLFTAEALLRHHDWSREQLLEAWISNPKECCENSGVKPPENPDGLRSEHRLSSLEQGTLRRGFRENMTCAICWREILLDQPLINIPCSHLCCKDCWERYLTGKIQEGNTTNILCPVFECYKLVPLEVIESIVSPDMASRYQQFDIKAFVESNPNLKWCPKVACGRAVKIPDYIVEGEAHHRGSSSSPNSPPPMSRAVDCGIGHFFCWDCCGEPHAPCSCENWKKWNDKIKEIQPESLTKTEEETESAANVLWLVTNSKACPKCSSPIQKNEGCNHMKCTKCKYDFCWVCLEPWSKHSSATGGYFRCNRYEVVQKVEEKADDLLSDAEKRMKEVEELNRFLHYYTRYRNHGNSFTLEEPLRKNVCHKMKRLSNQAKKMNEETVFIQTAIEELLKARVVLRFSYPYGYYLEDKGGSKQIFEFMQNELEESTETLSQMVARQFLRTPKSKVIHAMHLTTRKRNEFLSAVSKGFLPPDTPQGSEPTPPSYPHSEPLWREGSDDEDEAFRKAIEASIQDAMVQFSSQESPESSPSNQKTEETDRLQYLQDTEPPPNPTKDPSPSHSTAPRGHQRKQKSSRSSKSRHRTDRTITDEGPSSSLISSFDMDIQRAMALSLQESKQQKDTASRGGIQGEVSDGDREAMEQFANMHMLPAIQASLQESFMVRKEGLSPSKVPGKGAHGDSEFPASSRKGKTALRSHQSKSSAQSVTKGKNPSQRSNKVQKKKQSTESPGTLTVSPPATKLSASVKTSPSRVSSATPSATHSAPSSSKSSPCVRRDSDSSTVRGAHAEPRRQLSLRVTSSESMTHSATNLRESRVGREVIRSQTGKTSNSDSLVIPKSTGLEKGQLSKVQSESVTWRERKAETSSSGVAAKCEDIKLLTPEPLGSSNSPQIANVGIAKDGNDSESVIRSFSCDKESNGSSGAGGDHAKSWKGCGGEAGSEPADTVEKQKLERMEKEAPSSEESDEVWKEQPHMRKSVVGGDGEHIGQSLPSLGMIGSGEDEPVEIDWGAIEGTQL